VSACGAVEQLLTPYFDGELDAAGRARVDAHLAACANCADALREIAFAATMAGAIETPERAIPPFVVPAAIPSSRRWTFAFAAAAAVIAIVALSLWRERTTVLPWEAQLETASGPRPLQIRLGKWIESGPGEEAYLNAGSLGTVGLGGNTRARVVAAGDETRIELARGRLWAEIAAPPRLFIVETPSAVATDLGCAYNLTVEDDGATLLEVTSGWVELAHGGLESFVPAGASCRSEKGRGPGVPVLEDATAALKAAVFDYESRGGGREAIARAVAASRRRDAITLWHLVARVEADARAMVFDRLASYVPPPDGATHVDAAMLERWREALEYATFGIDPRKVQPAAGEIVEAAPMIVPRFAHTATLLGDGTVLLAGGESERVVTASAEVFDPRASAHTRVANMNEPRAGHTATALLDGRVLIAGGSPRSFFRGALASTELYDPHARTFTSAGAMREARLGHRATLLADGRVLITGGQNESGTKLAGAELFDPATGAFTPAGSMASPRFDHAATLLGDGTVLVSGGAADLADVSAHRDRVLASCERFDPRSNSFHAAGSMAIPRYKHSATLLPDGRVFILGGSDTRMVRHRYATTEIYDPLSGIWSVTPNMTAARYKIRDAVVVLDNGDVLVAGGGARAEVWDSRQGFFRPLAHARSGNFYSTATRLDDGRVFIAGGYAGSLRPVNDAWIFRAEKGEHR
jgi:ferric-dicitrate binding protein FerR (iron transport regulator)